MPVTLNKHDGIALISINNPPVNALSQAVRAGLLEAVVAAIAATDVNAVVIHCEGKTFIAGADVREFNRPPLLPHLGQPTGRVMNLIGLAPRRSVAVNTASRRKGNSATINSMALSSLNCLGVGFSNMMSHNQFE